MPPKPLPARLTGLRGGGAAAQEADAIAAVRTEIERWRNHFADLDAQAEALADELRLGSADLYGAIAERLRVKHQLSIRILPVDVMPDRLKRLDLHARQLQLSANCSIPPAAPLPPRANWRNWRRTLKSTGWSRGANFAERASERLYRRHLTSYFAAAMMMPYARFLRACEATGYDIELLQRRFGAGFEQVAHRLTTLQRVGARGLPFFMIRIDRAGQSSKRYAGASGSPLVETDARCPLWHLHNAFDRPGQLVQQIWSNWKMAAAGSRWRAPSTRKPARAGRSSRFAIGLGLDAKLAAPLAAARGLDLMTGEATPIGLGCRACTRPDCAPTQRPASRPGAGV